MSICYNCFKDKENLGSCPACGYDPAGAAEKYPMALHPGSILNGRYIVGRVLGQGGFGITYIALDDRTGKRVAIKEYLPTEFAGRNGGSTVNAYSREGRENFEFGKERFLEEAKTLAEFIGDEHIVRIYSYFEENGTAYFTMEYVEGKSLDKYTAAKGGRLSTEEANELLLPLMDALEDVHSKGIVHRDIAPDNIIITPEGKAKLLDFGAARYSTGEKSKSLDVVIKHGFAPKEQYLRRGRQGPFTDVYAMAATYYYAITGKIPAESIGRMDEDDLVPPSSMGIKLGDKTEDALLKALEVSSANRYQHMGEFRAAMATAGEEERRKREEKEKEAAERARQEREKKEREAREREEAERQRREKDKKEAADCEQKEKDAVEASTEDKADEKTSEKKKHKIGIVFGLIALAAVLAVVVMTIHHGQAEAFHKQDDDNAEILIQGSEMATGAGQTIPDGDYIILWAYDSNYFLDIPGTAVPAENGNNVWIYSVLSLQEVEVQPWDYWSVRYVDEGGFYEICQKGTDMALDVWWSSQEEGANIQVYEIHHGSNQLWSISPCENGYRLQAKCSGFALEIVDGNAQQGHADDNNNTQGWIFEPVKSVSTQKGG